MAVWQFDAHLLSEDAIRRRYGGLPVAVSRSEIDSGELWQGVEVPADLPESLSSLLPQAPSWSESIQSWGQEDGDRIDLVWDSGELADIFLRVDVRRVSYELLSKIMKLARTCRWLLWVDGRVTTPSLEQLLRAVQRSDAFRFVNDPQAFLRELERTVEREATDR